MESLDAIINWREALRLSIIYRAEKEVGLEEPLREERTYKICTDWGLSRTERDKFTVVWTEAYKVQNRYMLVGEARWIYTSCSHTLIEDTKFPLSIGFAHELKPTTIKYTIRSDSIREIEAETIVYAQPQIHCSVDNIYFSYFPIVPDIKIKSLSDLYKNKDELAKYCLELIKQDELKEIISKGRSKIMKSTF